ncbi:MAG TPA: hypothetical protein VIV60_09325, partial [Polyangiaceae bacterium]
VHNRLAQIVGGEGQLRKLHEDMPLAVRPLAASFTAPRTQIRISPEGISQAPIPVPQVQAGKGILPLADWSADALHPEGTDLAKTVEGLITPGNVLTMGALGTLQKPLALFKGAVELAKVAPTPANLAAVKALGTSLKESALSKGARTLAETYFGLLGASGAARDIHTAATTDDPVQRQEALRQVPVELSMVTPAARSLADTAARMQVRRNMTQSMRDMAADVEKPIGATTSVLQSGELGAKADAMEQRLQTRPTPTVDLPVVGRLTTEGQPVLERPNAFQQPTFVPPRLTAQQPVRIEEPIIDPTRSEYVSPIVPASQAATGPYFREQVFERVGPTQQYPARPVQAPGGKISFRGEAGDLPMGGGLRSSGTTALYPPETSYGPEFERFKNWVGGTKDRYALEESLKQWEREPDATGMEGSRKKAAVKLLQDKLTEVTTTPVSEQPVMARQGLTQHPIDPVTKSMGTARDILTRISQNQSSAYNQIAAKALTLLDEDALQVGVLHDPNLNPLYGGEYRHYPESIAINTPALRFDQTHIHEILHAATVKKLKKEIGLQFQSGLMHETELRSFLNRPNTNSNVKRLVELYFEAKNKMSVAERSQYGMTNIKEFVAEAWSDSAFQDSLRKIKDTGTNLSLWDKVKDAFFRLLGLEKENPTLLSNVIEESGQIAKAKRGEFPSQPVPPQPPSPKGWEAVETETTPSMVKDRLFSGVPVPDNSAELAERLKESAIKTPVYHVTERKYDRADPQTANMVGGGSIFGMHFASKPGQAQTRAEDLALYGMLHRGDKGELRTTKYWLDIRNPLRVSDNAANVPFEMLREMREQGIFTVEEADRLASLPYHKLASGIVDSLQRQGYDGLEYENMHEGPGKSYVAFDKQQIINALVQKRAPTGELYAGVPLPSKEEVAKRVGEWLQSKDPSAMLLSAPRLLMTKEQSGFADVVKDVDAQQLWNRIVNKLPVEAKVLQDMGIADEIKKAGRISPAKAAAIIQEKGPKVEVRKLNADRGGDIADEARSIRQQMAGIQHWLDTTDPSKENHVFVEGVGYRLTKSKAEIPPVYAEEMAGKVDEYNRLSTQLGELGDTVRNENESATARYTMVNPKPLADMPGAVDLLVRIPLKQGQHGTKTTIENWKSEAGIKFPASQSHYPTEGNNLLVHVRGYMETVGGKKIFHVFELQSDWGQQFREAMANKLNIKEVNPGDWSSVTTEGVPFGRHYATREEALRNVEKDIGRSNDPLLRDYERLGLKAAIEHARKEGADAIAVSDAETAMMSEGHDKPPRDVYQTVNINGKKVEGRQGSDANQVIY